MFTIVYADVVVSKDLPNIPELWKTEIKNVIEAKLMTRPAVYSRPLRRSLKGYRKLRVGAYRIVFRIEDNVIKVFVIQHRSTVYSTASQRI